MLRSATLADLGDVVSWIPTARDCELWAGWRVSFPIDRTFLPAAIGFTESNAFSLIDGEELVAFGQLVRKSPGRGHLAQLIVKPGLRGKGHGEMLVRALLDRARIESFESVSLNVDSSNLPAVSLYLKVGFMDAARPPDEPESAGARYMEMSHWRDRSEPFVDTDALAEAAMLPFQTDRLIVRPPEQSDLPTLFTILGDADVMKLALYERPFSESEARRFIESDFAKDSADVTKLGVVCRRSHSGPIGFAGIFPCQYLPGELEFGFVFATHAQGQGFATEIGKKFIDVGFRELDRDRMHALCNPHNVASREVLSRKLGMTFIETIITPDRGPRSALRRVQTE